MTKTSKQISWGIIRYAPGSGKVPDQDAAGFDGWYSDRADALAVAEVWVAEYPYWIVALVRSDTVWFSDRDFHAARDRPLTVRERRFCGTGH
jgi:hypothetical protein